MNYEIISQLLTGAIGGAIITSLIAPYINRTTERRKNRADVMEAIIQVESDRWAGKGNAKHSDFRRSIVILKAKAMIAGGIDSRIVNEYIEIAQIARKFSDADYYPDGVFESDEPTAGSIPASLSNLASGLAENLIEYVVKPFRSHSTNKVLNEMRNSVKKYKDKEKRGKEKK